MAREAVEPERGYGTHAVTNTLNNLAVSELWFGAGPAAAAESLREAAELAARRGLERPTHWYRGNLAEVLYELGEWDEVVRIKEEIEAWERVRGRSLIGVFAPPFAARILAARGALAAAAAIVDELLPRSRDAASSITLANALVAASAVATAQGDSALAFTYLAELEELITGPEEALGYLPAIFGHLPEIGRLLLAIGELERAERLLGQIDGPDPRLDRFVSSAQAILAEARSEHDHAVSLYEKAGQAWKEYSCVIEHAHALAGLGRCRLALHRPDAAGPLQESREIFAKLGAASLVAEMDERVNELSTLSA